MAYRSETGHSRAKGNSRAKGSRSSNTSSASSRTRSTSTGRTRSSAGNSNYSRNTRNARKSSGNGFARIAVGGVLLIVVIAVIAGILKGMGSGSITGAKESEAAETEMETTTVPETELQTPVSVNGIDITGMTRAEAKEALDKAMPWGMKVTYNDQTYEVKNLIDGRISAVLDEVYGGSGKESYQIDVSGLQDAAANEAAVVAGQWNKKAKNGSISSYNAETNKFVFAGAENGIEVDQKKLAENIQRAVENGDYKASLTASVNTVEPEFSEAAAKEKYKTVSTFTTKTTSNSKRNTNIKLAASAINGTVLQPGQEFSFNGVVGQRTEAKGYKGAAAYNNGEVVEEIGGGVCQVSSTLYNAVVKAGLKTTKRQSHTFEPSYVTPGTDATVSWGGPDYKFINNSNAAIGIRAHYADQELTISIYAVPILDEGVTYSLSSSKTKDYTTGTPEEQASGYQSAWQTRLVVKKNGEIVSQEVDHTTKYKKHTTANDAAEAAAIKAAEEAAKLAAESAAAESSAAAETIEAPTAESSESGSGKPSGGSSTSTEAPGGSGTANITGGPGSSNKETVSPIQETTAAPKPVQAPPSAESAQAPTPVPVETIPSPAPSPTPGGQTSEGQAPGGGTGGGMVVQRPGE